jgi:nicotinamidase-related amidase
MEQNTALLVMDMQKPILANLPDQMGFVSKVAMAISMARKKGIPVIYVQVVFRKGLPELTTSNKAFSPTNERFTQIEPGQWMEIHPDAAPLENDIIVTKKRISAFAGSDLELILRAQRIQHLVLCGIATGGVVLSTLREAADKDYRLTVLSDACIDADEEVHRVLTTKIFPRQADVITIDAW